MTRARDAAVAGFVAAAAALVTSCALPAADGAEQAPVPEVGVDLLAQLAIAPEDPTAPYSAEIRDAEWGDGWDSRGRGCDTRDVVLAEQSSGQIRVGEGCRPDCVAAEPCWTSPYDGRPTYDPRDLEIDHVVPVAEAAKSPVVGSGPGGEPAVAAALAWSTEQKHAFYEDLQNLVAVTGSVNQSKSDGDPAEWKPSNRDYWREYATAYATVKVTHGLSVDQAEFDALQLMLSTG